ncbi:hypothetical protein HZ994_16635 [Akkermansiaceae bacterium]|nr:hypothetical protein HZ994_16635 [Akkermansiaceae bacterium]
MKTKLNTIAALAGLTMAVASCASGTSGTAGSGNVVPYTSQTCAVSGNKLGSMGDPVTKVYGNKEVKFCCKPCVAKYEKNPEKYASNIH